MSKLFLEQNGCKSAGAPKDINASAFAGERIKMDKGYSLAIVCRLGDSVGATVQFDLDQHDAAAAGTSKALDIQSNYYHKTDAAASFTKVDVRADDAVLSDSADLSAALAADEGTVVFHVEPEHLDTNNDFAYVSLNIADSTAAKIASVTYYVKDIKVGMGYEQSL